MKGTIKLLASFLIGVAITGCTSYQSTNIGLTQTQPQCKKVELVSIHCGKTPTLIGGNDQRIRAVFEHNQFIYFTYSDDNGINFAPAKRVNKVAEIIYTNGENRPKIKLGKNNQIYLSWTRKTAGRFNGDIRFSRSLDAGKTFSPAITVNDDKLLTGHRFDSMEVANDGSIFISWIDKRDNFALTKQPSTPSSAAIYYAVSTNSGKSFAPNKKLLARSCVCCRIAMTAIGDDQVGIFWRHIFDTNVRDHALAILNKQKIITRPHRATFDQWQIDACPHHGPSISQDLNANLHLTWFTAGEKNKGLNYAFYDLDTQQISRQFSISSKASASHPYVNSIDSEVYLVWKEFDGLNTSVYLISSDNNGISWRNPLKLSQTSGQSDHPLMFRKSNEIWLNWSTQEEGLQLVKVKRI